MCYSLLEGHTEDKLWTCFENKIELHLFQQYFTPPTPLLKQGESKTTFGPDLPSTRIIRSTIPFRKCFKSCQISWPATARKQQQDSHALFSPIRKRNL